MAWFQLWIQKKTEANSLAMLRKYDGLKQAYTAYPVVFDRASKSL